MKNILTITIALFALMQNTQAQNINWRSIGENQQNIVSLSTGYDYSLMVQTDYYRVINTFRPIAVGANFSIPMGKTVFDDFKIEYGGLIEVYEIRDFSFTAGVMGNFRQHKTGFVTMSSFGLDLSATIGYYRPKWHVAIEGGFDKAISTHLKHSDEMREIYPGIADGWMTATGGNFYYGIQGSKTIGERFDINLRAGFTNAQFKDMNAVLPYYAQIGVNFRF
ncbi:MAG: hypothetical protein QNK23_15415 [Crocinitomicaceae bacterium]|nr:hypothetical protein [Crocinitomicaceae bacterium]